MSKLPTGWVYTDLATVLLKVVGGGTPSKKNHEYYDGNIPFMTVKDMKTPYPKDTEDKISLEALQDSSTNLIPADTLIISTRMGLGKICRAPFETAINQDLKALFINDAVSKDYLFYWFKKNAPLLESLGKGTTVKGIRLEVLKSLQLELPPFDEQVEIAKKIDVLLEEVRAAKLNLDAIPSILKRFRRSVLKKYLSSENNWSSNKLGNLLEDLRYGTAKKSTYDGVGTPILRIPNISEGRINSFDLKYTKLDKAEYSKLSLMQGDVLIIRSNGSLNLVGKTAVVSQAEVGWGFAGYLMRLRFDVNKIYPPFLNYYLDSPKVRNYIESVGRSTSGVNNINSKDVENIEVIYPDYEEQVTISHKIMELMSLADVIEEKYFAARANIDVIEQSILNKAFRGELVPQNLQSESALSLLSRVKSKTNSPNVLDAKTIIRSRKSSQKAKKMILSILAVLKAERKALTTQSLFKKAGYPPDADSQKIEEFFIDIKKCLNDGSIVRTRTKDEDVFKLAGKKT